MYEFLHLINRVNPLFMKLRYAPVSKFIIRPVKCRVGKWGDGGAMCYDAISISVLSFSQNHDFRSKVSVKMMVMTNEQRLHYNLVFCGRTMK